MNPIDFELLHQQLGSVCQEMGRALQRSAFSPNIKERCDFSCAVFSRDGEMLAQAEHIPVHLGAMPASVRAAIRRGPLGPGDAVLLNDPFHGGSHLPDLTLVSPVFVGKRLLFHVANRAHHADVGGMAPGSMPLATELYQEGLRIPPVLLYRRGRPERDVFSLFLANVRGRAEREGDLRAQFAANLLGAARLRELAGRWGGAAFAAYGRAFARLCGTSMRRLLAAIPAGSYAFADALDGDGTGSGRLPVRARVTVGRGRAHVDFTGTAPQVRGCVNAPAPVALSAVFYVFRCLTDEPLVLNRWTMAPIRVTLPEGSLVNPRPPAAVCGGNVETSQRIVDVLLGALSRALPGRIPAASSGSMTNVVIGGTDPAGRPFSYYETVAGGAGAGPAGAGASALQTHMTNTFNTPAEALEHAYPLEIVDYAIRRGTGGAGRHRGGDGVLRAYKLLCDARVSLLTERRESRPYGLAGGGPGAPGRNMLLRGGERIPLPSKANLDVRAGDVLVLETSGGGGWGRERRNPKSQGRRERDLVIGL
ncbi:MAG: hydantoinase B/oxoprolinase family protein [Planctomycetes bacterium]|nr:hydantoinase B/oxoprolinase family protein [Planctomycetota bacterium]